MPSKTSEDGFIDKAGKVSASNEVDGVLDFFIKQIKMVKNLLRFEDYFLHFMLSIELDLINIGCHW